MSVHYWRDGEPTEDGVVAFTEGDCWILAIHLNRLLDWPVYLVDGGEHWVVRKPGENLYLDVRGMHTRSQILYQWRAKSLARAEQVDPFLLEYARTDAFEKSHCEFKGSHQRAPVMARRLIEKYV